MTVALPTQRLNIRSSDKSAFPKIPVKTRSVPFELIYFYKPQQMGEAFREILIFTAGHMCSYLLLI